MGDPVETAALRRTVFVASAIVVAALALAFWLGSMAFRGLR